MPIREYHCKACNGTFERRFTSNEVADKAERFKRLICPCGGEAERTISRVGRPQFKGDGFYETEYKK